jgi:serine/threonine protein kinase/tetratricopeptide (TPR) repeat protein
MRDLIVGQEIGGYQLQEVLGQGGMGVVYLALERGSGREVALKTVHRAHHRYFVGIRREVQLLLGMQHPYIVRVLAQGVSEEGAPWYAMELLKGGTLAHMRDQIRTQLSGCGALDEGAPQLPADAETIAQSLLLGTLYGEYRLPGTQPAPPRPPAYPLPATRRRVSEKLPMALRLVRRLCLALSHLHSQGLVHQDLKPDNIFVRSNGEPVLMDFGVASRFSNLEGRDVMDVQTLCQGTPAYMAPEQICGLPVDARADYYALGCILYELVTGRFPFPGQTLESVFYQHVYGTLTRPSALVEGVEPALEALILRLMARERSARFGYAADVLAALDALGVSEEAGERALLAPQSYLCRPQLVGRLEARDQLLSKMVRAIREEGGVAALVGESGVGKTFLSKAVAAAVRHRVGVMVGECVRLDLSQAAGGGAAPLHPLRPLLQAVADLCREEGSLALLGDHGPVLAPYEVSLARLPGVQEAGPAVELPPEAARERLLRALLFVLDAFAARKALLLMMDDVQWADELTLALLGALAARPSPPPGLLVLLTCRAEELQPPLEALLRHPAVERIALSRLDQASAEAMVAEMLALPSAPPALTQVLWELGEGNPFFVSEYLRLAVSEGLLRREDGRWITHQGQGFEALGLPRSLRALFARRLEGLGEEALALAEMSAVLGREVDLRVLVQLGLLEDQVASAALAALLERRVLEISTDEALRFPHDRLREHIYDTISVTKRMALHREAGLALEALEVTPGRARALLVHFERAGDQRRTLAYLLLAGREALAALAHGDAIAYLERAAALLPRRHPGDRLEQARVHRQLGECYLGLHRAEEARRHLEEATRLLGWPIPREPGQLARAFASELARQGALRARGRRFHLPRLSEPHYEGARAFEMYQNAIRSTGDHALILYSTLKALNLAEAGADAAALVRSYALAQVIVSAMGLGDLARHFARLASAALAHDPGPEGRAWAHQMSSIYYFYRGSLEPSRREAEAARALGAEIGFAAREEEATVCCIMTHFVQGRFEELLQDAERLAALAQRGSSRYQLWACVFLAHALNRLGEGEAAARHLAHARRWYDLVDPTDQLFWDASAAREAAQLGRRGEALGRLQLALRRLAAVPPMVIEGFISACEVAEATLYLWAGASAPERATLLEGLRRCVSWLRRSGLTIPIVRPEALFWRGVLAWLQREPAQAARLLAQSAAQAASMAVDYTEARARFALACCLEAPTQAALERQKAHTLLARRNLDPESLGALLVLSKGESL